MSTIDVRELARNASAIINELDETKEPAMITRRGRPVAYMLPVDSAQFEDFVLARLPRQPHSAPRPPNVSAGFRRASTAARGCL